MQSNLHQLKYTHNIMKFKQVKLSEVANIFAGYPFKGNNYSDKGVRVVRGDNVTIGHLRWTIGKDKRWNEPFDQFEYYSLHENDIVIGMDGSRVGMNRAQIKHEDLPLLLAQRVACIRNNSNSIQDYLYYQIFSNNFVRYIKAIHTGTSIPHVSLKQIGDFAIPLPSLSDQRKIAGILSALDSKIENNNKINANLEAQAQALFKSWFVDFTPFKDQPFIDSELGPIPQGWKVGTLGEFFPIVTGKKDANISSKSGKYPFFSCSQNISWTNDYSFDDFAIIVAGNGDFNVKWYNGKFEAYQRTYVLIPYNPTLTSWLYYAVKYNLNMITIGARGSVIKFITKGDIQNFKVAYPQNIDKHEIVKMLGKINKDIEHNKNEVSCLAKLRDTLLPKLMSGEIKL